MNKIIVTEIYQSTRLDSFLSTIGAYKSRSLAAKFCDSNKVFVNGQTQSKNYKLNVNDEVKWESTVEDHDVIAQDIPLDIRFEDDDIIVLSKQPGLVCHPAHGHADGTLVNALVHHCGKDNLCNIQENDNRLGIVHRLDADTSGLMICAKTNEAGIMLSDAMRAHSTLRCYKTLVYGNLKHDNGKIDVPLLRTLNKRPKMIASIDAKAKTAVTTFKVIERIESQFGNFTLLECKLETGRTHQIRAHMEYIRHAVVGDHIYNGGAPKDFDAEAELGLTRQFLHSYKIGFNHPRTNEYMEFEDTLAPDLQKVLEFINAK